jgi:hypothetical protein
MQTQTTGDVVQATRSGERLVTAQDADRWIDDFEQDPFYVVRREWDRVSYSVSVTRRGDIVPVLGWAVPLDDMAWRGDV